MSEYLRNIRDLGLSPLRMRAVIRCPHPDSPRSMLGTTYGLHQRAVDEALDRKSEKARPKELVVFSKKTPRSSLRLSTGHASGLSWV